MIASAWIWDAAKDTINRSKHGLSLAAAVPVLEGDPSMLSRSDRHPDGDRWQSIGMAPNGVILFIVHTLTFGDLPKGRIIGVRKATPYERQAYATQSW